MNTVKFWQSESTPLSVRSHYSNSLKDFLCDDADNIYNRLVSASNLYVTQEQRYAWKKEIDILKSKLNNFGSGHIFLEFTIPRMGKRVDAILIFSGMVFVIEFKVGAHKYKKADIDQCEDYALDLKDFHEGSHNLPIVPVLVATDAPSSKKYVNNNDHVFSPMLVRSTDLGKQIMKISGEYGSNTTIDAGLWESSKYHPTPTIVEAARALYAEHAVSDITHSSATAENITITTKTIEDIIHNSKTDRKKSICFVTGVPGAGKTLVGLNLAIGMKRSQGGDNVVYLSGNDSLVNVLREALARDHVDKCKQDPNIPKITKLNALHKIQPAIQMVRHFLAEYIKNKSAPSEKIIVFDEAQRAWDSQETDKFVKKIKGKDLREADLGKSQPELLIEAMNKHDDWAMIVCLVGGGQEINHNEAGLPEWFSVIRRRYQGWDVYLSHEMTDNEYLQNHNIEDMLENINPYHRPGLHLATSIRSFRSEHVSRFVKSLLDLDQVEAKKILNEMGKYQIVLTRDFSKAKEWLQKQARGSRRFGVVATAKSYRLRPHGIYAELKPDAVHWFLNSYEDTRSSFRLEYVATQFQVQGLELDWVCVAWDADLRYEKGKWEYKEFRYASWIDIKKDYRKRFLKNAYRVLLTRAREGMVIFVPEGDSEDDTRDSQFYDKTYRYLRNIGIPDLNSSCYDETQK